MLREHASRSRTPPPRYTSRHRTVLPACSRARAVAIGHGRKVAIGDEQARACVNFRRVASDRGARVGEGGGGACARAHARILGGRKATDRVGRYPEGARGGRGGAARSAWRGTAAEGDLSRCSHSGRKGLRSRGWHPAGASEHPNALPTTNQPSGSDRTSQPDRRGPLPHL